RYRADAVQVPVHGAGDGDDGVEIADQDRFDQAVRRRAPGRSEPDTPAFGGQRAGIGRAP
ncbi:MAG: hypothetical protein V3R89_02830, partial [Thermoanaerobaculia bacterium]